MVVADNMGRALDEREYKFRPVEKHQWDKEAEQVHKVSWREAQDFPCANQSLVLFYDDINSICGSKNEFICHALPIRSRVDLFDYQFLLHSSFYRGWREAFYQTFSEDLVQSTISRHHTKAKKLYGIENQQLSTWIKKLNLKTIHHNALDDARACYEIYKYQQHNQQAIVCDIRKAPPDDGGMFRKPD